MEFRRAYKQMIKAVPGGWSAMAAALGLSQQSLENRVYEKKGQGMSVHIALQMQEISGTKFFAEAAAANAGGVFLRLPSVPNVGNEELFDKFLQLNTRLGDLSREYMEATADGVVDEKEWARLSRISQDTHTTLAEIMAITDQIFRYKGE